MLTDFRSRNNSNKNPYVNLSSIPLRLQLWRCFCCVCMCFCDRWRGKCHFAHEPFGQSKHSHTRANNNQIATTITKKIKSANYTNLYTFSWMTWWNQITKQKWLAIFAAAATAIAIAEHYNKCQPLDELRNPTKSVGITIFIGIIGTFR